MEKKLGITPAGEGSSSKPKDVEPEVLAGKKHRFDDTEYLEQSRELVDGVKSAVAAGLLKKRKKAKTTLESADKAPRSNATTLEKVTGTVVESAATAPIAVATSVVAGVAASA